MGSEAPAPASSGRETSRRRLLAFLGAGGAAGLASLFARNDAQAGHDSTNVFHLGEDNTNPAGTRTVLHANGDRALDVEGTVQMGSGAAGPALSAGDQNIGGKAIDAIASGGVAVYGTGRDGPGGEPANGVVGASATTDGTEETGSGIGVAGKTGSGVGVLGSTSTSGVGVEARTTESETPLAALALLVRGKSAYTTAGSAVIPAGANSAFVSNPAVTEESHVTVTLTSNPGPRVVRFVDPSPGSGFTVHLSFARAVNRPETSLTYLVVEIAES